jgi:endonuclease YncB( thermonuclease family)
LGQTPSVVDGDTVKLAGVSIRLVDFDSPELFSSNARRNKPWHCRPGASCRRC